MGAPDESGGVHTDGGGLVQEIQRGGCVPLVRGTNKKIQRPMKIIETPFDGLYLLETVNFKDERGGFQKLFNYDFFKENGLDSDFKEFYYSVSQKNVIRGMHFQLPPHDHTKIVYVSKGRIHDVVLDIRKESKTFGKAFDIELDADKALYLYIPKGFAHGFASLEDGSITNYAQTSCYDKEHDCGIDHDSFGFDWGIDHPICSGRDTTFVRLSDFKSPF
jgi:dTDP-4-dehydrorhamnose 3,5-epimerase